MATDLVCRKEVDEKNPSGGKVNFWGKVFYFCSKDCRVAFRRDPQKYSPETAEGRGPGYDKAKASETWRT
jgi:YHS domain-containing protein